MRKSRFSLLGAQNECDLWNADDVVVGKKRFSNSTWIQKQHRS